MRALGPSSRYVYTALGEDETGRHGAYDSESPLDRRDAGRSSLSEWLEVAEKEGFIIVAPFYGSYDSVYRHTDYFAEIVEDAYTRYPMIDKSRVFDFERKRVTLNSGYEMPILGLGMFSLSDSEAENSTYWALKAGFRLIDTARIYGNGDAAIDASLDKDEIECAGIRDKRS